MVVLILLAGPVPQPARAAGTGQAGSAVTVSGRKGTYDDFSRLKVTVAQTKNLTNQGVRITWTGGTATGPGRYFGRDYLQIMQCWGADPNAADFRETCQFGMGTVSSDSGQGYYAPTRDVTYGAGLRDPAETLPAAAHMVPFRTVTGARTPPTGTLEDLKDYFRPDTTNEVPYARTAGDGGGGITFEVQDSTQAPGLGCGDPVAGRTDSGRGCWLVIVPRGAHDPRGNAVGQQDGGADTLDGSPLAPTAFANRIVVPLSFQKVGSYCSLSKKERQTVGSELMALAIRSWQPALCAGTGPVFGFAPAGDTEAGQYLRRPGLGAPSIGFVTDPVRRLSTDPPIVHAPVALSGAVIAFEVETKVDPGAEPDVERLAGTQIRDLKLTPRLVAKLLTQSYVADVPNGTNVDSIKTNPANLRQDREFLTLNPRFAQTARNFRPDGLMVAGGNSALARQVWEWILADDEARAWLAGKADDQGPGKPPMVVNRNYSEAFAGGLAPESFPKLDPHCVDPDGATGTASPWCTLDLRPYLGGLQAAAKQTLRGDAQVKNYWDITAIPPSYKAAAPQAVGQRFALSITDSAAAYRYGLPTASLRNRAGEFVAPTAASIARGVSAMEPTAVAGVIRTNPRKPVPGAYPLSMLTYAAVNLAQDRVARQDDAAFLSYAAGAGQVPGVEHGQLPPGYVALPAALRNQTSAAVKAVRAGVPAGTAPSGTPTAGAPPGAQPAPAATPTRAPDRGSVPRAAPSPHPSSAGPDLRPVALRTAGAASGPLRFLFLAIAVIGAGSLIIGPLLLRRGRGVRP